MGRRYEELKITARLSAYNSEQDDEDEKTWNELCDRIRKILDEPRYADISPFIL